MMRLCTQFLFLFVLGACTALLSSSRASAFDTGYHFDLSRIILKREGLGADAINTALLANWLTDYHSTSPTANNLLLKPALNRLHFDNKRNAGEAENYYYWFMSNLQMLVTEAARENDRIKMLTAVGVAHHVIQDFYSHSNWADLYKRRINGSFDADLFPRRMASLKGKLRTGTWPGQGEFAHGGYTNGLNKDSHVRPNWENAYVLAYAATRQITLQMRNWTDSVRPDFWEHLGRLNLTEQNRAELLRDIKSAHDISMWVKANVLGLPASDGHWKGNLSGDAGKFAASNNAFNTWKNSFLSRYFRSSKTVLRLALNLDKDNPPKARYLTDIDEDGHAIIVKIHSFRLTNPTSGLGFVGARVRINDEIYIGRVFSRPRKQASSAIPSWHEIHIEPGDVRSTWVEISLFAHEVDGKINRVPIDISPQENSTSLTISLDANTSLADRLKEKLTGIKTEILRSGGNGENSAEIAYSIEIHEVD